MKHEMEPLGRTLIIYGNSGGVGLAERKTLTDEQIEQNDLTFQRCGKVLGWEWADNTAEMMDRKLTAQAKQMRLDFETQEDRAKRNRLNVREYAEVRGLAAQTMLVRVCTAEFFPLEKRRRGLDFSHHAEVWGRGIDIGTACEWLDKADAGDGDGKRWSVARLREELNRAKTAASGEEGGEPDIEEDVPREVSRFECWAATRWKEMENVKPMEAMRLLGEMQSAVRLIDHLRARVGTFPHGQNLPTGYAKESLMRAS